MEPVKTGVDVGSVGSSLLAFLNVFNPFMEAVVLTLTAAWFIYRFVSTRLGKKSDND